MDMVNTRFKWEEANGTAKYIADRHFEGVLEGRFYCSTCPRGLIQSVSLPPLPDSYHLFEAKDVPGQNVLPIVEIDWPAFADNEVRFVGQVIYLLVGPDANILDKLLNEIKVEYQPLTAAYTVEQSKALVCSLKRNPSCRIESECRRSNAAKSRFELFEKSRGLYRRTS